MTLVIGTLVGVAVGLVIIAGVWAVSKAIDLASGDTDD